MSKDDFGEGLMSVVSNRLSMTVNGEAKLVRQIFKLVENSLSASRLGKRAQKAGPL